MKSSGKKLRDTILRLDLFGEPVGFTIDGDGSHKSCLGLSLSFFILATMIPYSFKKFQTLNTFDDVTVTEFIDYEGKQTTDTTLI